MSKPIELLYAFREANTEDYNFMLNSWLNTWRDENLKMSKTLFYKQAEPMFKSIINRFGAVIACNRDNPNQIYSYAIAAYLPDDEWVLFWIYTKSLYSDLGIATSLFNLLKGNRKGPICPFVRHKSKQYKAKYGVIEAPMMLPKLLAMPNIESSKQIFEERE